VREEDLKVGNLQVGSLKIEELIKNSIVAKNLLFAYSLNSIRIVPGCFGV